MKIFCVGRNYAEHARELGNEVPTEPVIFMKPDTALLKGGGRFCLPAFSKNIQHEVELVLHISSGGKHLSSTQANECFDSIGIGLDLTARDLQAKLKASGLPWEKAKAFDGSAPVSREFIAKAEITDLSDIRFSLAKNGEVVQSGHTADLLFGFDQLIAHLSMYFRLEPGDLVFTGTPAGVGTLKAGDRLRCYISNREMLTLAVD